MPEERSFTENIKRKAILTIIALPLIWLIAKAVGLPLLYRWMFTVYVVLIFLFLILLDIPPMAPRKRKVLSIAATFLIGSALYTLIGMGLPQYNPEIEMEKIRKLTVERLKVEEIESPEELVEAGKDVYDLYECYNCHKIGGEGGVKTRGPELDEIGWESDLYIEESVLNPRAWIAERFDKPKIRDAMPDYFSEEFEEGEYKEWADKDWFDAVSMGVPGTPMQAWGVFLSEREIWEVAAYAATLSGVKGMTQNDLQAFLETENGKNLIAYLEKEGERKEKVKELKSIFMEGGEEEDK